jgi:pantoate kinase
MRVARAFVPGHITGLFCIMDAPSDPLYRGSLGAGFSIAAGTQTTVKVWDKTRVSNTRTTYNSNTIQAEVTEMVVQRVLKEHNQVLSVDVIHDSQLPIGVGYGASGAGALGTALSLSSLLDSAFDYTKAAQHAHCAEVLNHTGLGDVISQTVGGIEIRVKAGAPGIGSTLSVEYPRDASIVLAGSTSPALKRVLTTPESKRRINRASEELIDGLTKHPTLENIVNASQRFASEASLETPRIKRALADLSSSGFDMASMVMLGDSVFCICNPDDTSNVTASLKSYWSSDEIMVTSFSSSGGRVLT